MAKNRPNPRSRHARLGPQSLWDARDELRNAAVPWPDRPLVLVDIDGTLSNPQHRLWRVQGPGRKDWAGFFATCEKDPPVDIIVRWVRALTADHTVALVSGRPIDLAGEKTLDWLSRHQIPYFRIWMRQGRDHRPDTIVKQEILDDILRSLPKDRIAFAIDDRPSVVNQVWRRNAITVYPVRSTDDDVY